MKKASRKLVEGALTNSVDNLPNEFKGAWDAINSVYEGWKAKGRDKDMVQALLFVAFSSGMETTFNVCEEMAETDR